jgi:hypothetical protein
MPASEVMKLYREHKLHSGRGGKIVRSKKQAKAILLSYLRKEGQIPARTKKGKKKGKTAPRKRTTIKK